tara:strand:+ start:542 stop:718 length:177 start_codon:yes stop_codon:yes gene_type:complete
MIGKLIADFLLDPEMEKEIIDQIVAETDIPLLNEKSEAKVWKALFSIIKAVIIKKLGQ